MLDLFAGSGNLGIEAISNGASKCYFVDNNKKCISVINDNINTFGINNKCMVIYNDYNKALDFFKYNNTKFDIIFIDPPYKYGIMKDLLNKILDYNLLNSNGIVVLEYQNSDIGDIDINYSLLKNKKYGDKYISIYRIERKDF